MTELEKEKQMIKGVFDLNDTAVREIMVPRVDVIAISSASSIERALRVFKESGHNRIPVYNRTIDEITGIIIARDFLDFAAICKKTLSELVHKPVFIPESKSAADLLDELKSSPPHIAVVVDEYGGTAGIVTLEDIVEKIIGEPNPYLEKNIRSDKLDTDNSCVLEGRTLIDDVNEIFNVKLHADEDVDTIGGLVCSLFGRIPEHGEEIVVEGLLRVRVLSSDKRRILAVKASLTARQNSSKIS